MTLVRELGYSASSLYEKTCEAAEGVGRFDVSKEMHDSVAFTTHAIWVGQMRLWATLNHAAACDEQGRKEDAEREARDRVPEQVSVQRAEKAVVGEARRSTEDVVVMREVGLQQTEPAMLGGLPRGLCLRVHTEVDEPGIHPSRLASRLRDVERRVEEASACRTPTSCPTASATTSARSSRPRWCRR